MRTTVNVSATVPADLGERLRDACSETGLKRSTVIARALETHLAEMERKKEERGNGRESRKGRLRSPEK